MRTKKFEKRLSLNKQTVANLNVGEMKKSKGGATEPALCTTLPIEVCSLDTCKPLQCGPSLECPTESAAGDCSGAPTCEGYTCDVGFTCAC